MNAASEVYIIRLVFRVKVDFPIYIKMLVEMSVLLGNQNNKTNVKRQYLLSSVIMQILRFLFVKAGKHCDLHEIPCAEPME